VVLKDWSERGRAEDLQNLYARLSDELAKLEGGVAFVLVPPSIQGVGNAAGFQMEIGLRDNSFDFQKLQNVGRAVAEKASTQSGIERAMSPFRAGTPQLHVAIERAKAETLGVSLGDVFQALRTYLGSTYVNQFNRFGRTFQVYAQADHQYRVVPDEISRLHVRNASGAMVPLGTMIEVRYESGPSLISLDSRPSASRRGRSWRAPAQPSHRKSARGQAAVRSARRAWAGSYQLLRFSAARVCGEAIAEINVGSWGPRSRIAPSDSGLESSPAPRGKRGCRSADA
jgi:hypothetical protein